MTTKRNVTSPWLLGLAVGVASLLGACGADSGQATGSTCPADSTLTYENFGLVFMQTNCLSCHANREQPTLTTQAQIQANIDAIDRQAASGPDATNTAMPESGSVSTADRQRLGEWLACGAP